MATLLAFGLAFGVAPTPVAAWHATGHMITTQIAYDELSETARREVDRLIAVSVDQVPRRDHAVTASLWADDLKLRGITTFDRWHYINTPFVDGYSGELPELSFDNVVWAIDQAVSILRGDEDDLAKAPMLRLLLHFVGDIHQPLHCASRLTPEHPTGDRGGNDFLLAGKYEQLHAYWDYGADLVPAIDAEDWPQVGRRLTDETTRAVPKSAVAHWHESDPKVWAAESFRLAVEVGYAEITEGTEPSAEYTARARRVVHRRLALGGYRLAALLNDIFDGGQTAAVNP